MSIVGIYHPVPRPAPSREEIWDRLDSLERSIMEGIGKGLEPVVCPLVHRFTEGMYSRQITMPAGSLVVSKIHRTQHQFVVSRGRVSVLVAGGTWEEIVAPYHGFTEPGTRRVLYVHEETVWATFHPGDWKTVEEVEADIIEPRGDHLEGLDEGQRRALRAMQTGDPLAMKGGAPCHGSQ